MVLDSFMESYNRNVVIKGSNSDLTSFFEGVEPCTYEEAIETFFEAQYSVEAMAVITESAIMMESAGAAEMVNEGVVGTFVSAALEKIKDCSTKVKQFAVACVKKVIQFFKDLYAKATPIDKIMQQYGKKPVDYSDIQTAIANGFKIPGSMKILLPNPDRIIDEIMKPFIYNKGFNEAVTRSTSMLAASRTDLTAEKAKEQATKIKEELAELKEQDKERFTWVGQLLSDNSEYTKKTQLKKFIRTANEDKSKDGNLNAEEWKAISDYALNGQAKQRKYRTDIEATAKEAVKAIDEIAKSVTKMSSEKITNAKDEDKEKYGNMKANGATVMSAQVAMATYAANRSVMVMNRCIMPIMRKLHSTAIASYLYITSGTKSSNKKADKKAGI